MHAFALALALLSACNYSALGDPPADNHREELSLSPDADEARCETFATELSAPPGLLEADGGCDPEREPYCFRLAPELREVAADADPVAALTASAEAFAAFDASGDAADEENARALADLAVTGARAYARFAAEPPTEETLAGLGPPTGLDRALHRAYRVAWALHGPPSHRASARRELGWIAVSPEDDLPPRPVNVPSTPFSQRDVEVEARFDDGTTRRLRARAIIASTESPSEAPVPEPLVGSVPDENAAAASIAGDVVLYVHGHSSFSEESAGLAEELIRLRRERDEAFTLVAVDLPGSGYTERVDPLAILARADPARGQDVVLRFLDEFVDSTVDALEDESPGLSDRIVGVVGGSLGGNMAIRLAEQADERPWVRTAVAWSPVSIDYSWTRAKLLGGGDEGFMDVIKHEAVRRTHHESTEAEDRGARARYFTDGVMSVRKQSDYWYREDWPCGATLVEEGLRQLGEVYDARLRRFHYRLAYEQLVFSHIEPDDDGELLFRRIDVPLLVIAGTEDDAVPMKTRFFVDRLAPYLEMPGRTLFFEETGHAVHSERPVMLGRAIDGWWDEQPSLSRSGLPCSRHRRGGARERALRGGAGSEGYRRGFPGRWRARRRRAQRQTP
jgi:pimeloyl-ACP methyl ester carboxylesterase